MSIAPTSGIWHSAANALATPKPSTAGFKPSASKATAPSQPLADATHAHLTAVRQSGAFATDIMQALSAYRRQT